MTAPVGIYVRVSRKGDREDERFHSPREQAERAAALARARGYEVGPVFEDIDVSGAKAPADRPAMGALLKAIKSGELAGIAAFSLDRLSREPAHGDALVRTVTKAGGVLLTPDIPDAIDSPTGEFTFGMLLQVAKLYRSQAGARFATAKERSIRAGIPVGPTPVGYRKGDDRRLEIDPATAGAVREVFERWAAGEGRQTLVYVLERATGRHWTRNAVPKLIRCRTYMTGRLEYGDIVSEHDAGAIVDEALWHAAQRSPAPPRPKRREDSPWLLTGLATCATCGYNLSPHTTRGGGARKTYRYYRCMNRRCTSRPQVNAERLERWVALQAFAAEAELETRDHAPDLSALSDAAVVAERRVEQVLAPEARDALGELWAADVKARRAEHAAALAELGEARQAAGVAGARSLRLHKTWDKLSPADRRASLALVWRDVRVARRDEAGRLLVTLVARRPGAEAQLELPEDAAA